MCDMCRRVEGLLGGNDQVERLAMNMGREILTAQREWLRFAANETQAQSFMAEDNTEDVTAAWAKLSQMLTDKPVEEVASMVAAAVIELAFLTKYQREASEAASAGQKD